MSSKDDKYLDGDEQKTQVRSIINQLNEDRPSKEKSREVVVREDGTKVIRVTKKRRVLVSEREKNRHSRRTMVMGILVVLLALLGMAAFFGLRMSVMSGETYLADSVAALKEAWGAKDIRVSGKGVDGSRFHLNSLVAEFPEGNLIQRVELTNIEADMDSLSFFAKKLIADKLSIARAEIQLNKDVEKLELQQFRGEALWSLRRVECADFAVRVGDSAQESALSLLGGQAYLYHPRNDDDNDCVLSLDGGTLQLGAWKTIYLKEGKLNISDSAVEELKLHGSVNRPTESEESSRSELTIFGRLKAGDSLRGPLSFHSDNMELADFTNGRFEYFFTARTQSVPLNKVRATITLPQANGMPEFNGEMALKSICLSGMPAQTLITDHITPAKRRLYLPPRISRGFAVLSHEGDSVSVELPEGGAVERDLLIMKGKMTINAANELSGAMSYALPVLLTRVEYPDGISDPIFRENGEQAWLATTLSGLANAPTDNAGEVDREAEEARSKRPARIPFSQIDLDRMAEEAQKESAKLREGFEKPDLQPTQDSDNGDSNNGGGVNRDDPFGDTKQNTDDPFALPTPF